MKFLILSCLLGFAAASFVQRTAPSLDDSVTALWAGMSKPGSLRAALDMPEAYELDKVQYDIQAGMINVVKDHLNNLIENIKKRFEDGKEVTLRLWEEANQLKEKLKELGANVGSKVENFLKKLKERLEQEAKDKLGLDKDRLIELLNNVAQLNLKDVIKAIKEKILSNENIQKIREYIKNLVTTNPVLLKLKEIVAEMRNIDLRELVSHFLDHDSTRSSRSLKDMWEKVKGFFDDLNIQIKEKYMKFGNWVKENWGKGMDKLKENHGTIKAIAIEVLAHFTKIDKEILLEACEFLENYKGDLGELFFKIVELHKKIKGQ